MQVRKAKAVYPSLATALSTGITIPTGTQQPILYAQLYSYDNVYYKLAIQTAALSWATTNAALAVGQKLFTLPAGVVKPLGTSVKTVSTATTTTGTAGEVGLGTVIGSGANATIGAVGATSENVMEGKTISNHVAGTALTMKLQGSPVAAFDHGAGAVATGVNNGADGAIDTATAATDVFLNVASTYNAVGSMLLQAWIVTHFMFMGTDFGIE